MKNMEQAINHKELPDAAIEHMAKSFEACEPIITEGELRNLCEGSPDLEKLLESFLKYSVRYANDVWTMEKFVADGGLNSEGGSDHFTEIDEARTRLHNALIDSVAILSRTLAKEGKDNSWVRELTNGQTLERSACGKLALLLVYKRYLDINP